VAPALGGGGRWHNHCLDVSGGESLAGDKAAQLWAFRRMRERYGGTLFGYVPEAYILPEERVLHLQAVARRRRPSAWIVKPVAGARGDGVHLLRFDAAGRQQEQQQQAQQQQQQQRPGAASNLRLVGEAAVVQELVARPLLVGGRKWHARVYLLVLSTDPLVAAVHGEGLALFARQPYHSASAGDAAGAADDQAVFLTNGALLPTGNRSTAAPASARRLSLLLPEVARGLGLPQGTGALWQAMGDVLAKAVLSAPELQPGQWASRSNVVGFCLCLGVGRRRGRLQSRSGVVVPAVKCDRVRVCRAFTAH